jgi:4-amino-4-deoxy-L-arabinose transferase-like glycosyltransferase
VEILPGTYDQVSYHNLALRVLDGYGFSFGQLWWPLTPAGAPTAHWSFLYTLYLAIVYMFFGPDPILARLIQTVLVGLMQPLLAYLIGRRVFGEVVGLVAAALTAVYTYFVYYAATLMTEPFYICAILASLYLGMLIVDQASELRLSSNSGRVFRFSLGLGLALGIAILLRQLFLFFIPFLFLWIWYACRQKRAPAPIPLLLLSMVVVAIMILPVTIYNYVRFDRLVLLNTNAGYAFYWANHPIYGTHYLSLLPPEMGSYVSLVPENLRGLNEAALDQELLKLGIQTVLEDPIRFALLSLSRIPAYFMFWPSPDSSTISNISRVSSFGWLWPFMLYGSLLAVFRHLPKSKLAFSSPIFLLLFFAVFYSAIHLLSWALIRYRLPVDAVMLVFAGLAFADLAQRLGIWRQPSGNQARSTSAQPAGAARTLER